MLRGNLPRILALRAYSHTVIAVSMSASSTLRSCDAIGVVALSGVGSGGCANAPNAIGLGGPAYAGLAPPLAIRGSRAGLPGIRVVVSVAALFFFTDLGACRRSRAPQPS